MGWGPRRVPFPNVHQQGRAWPPAGAPTAPLRALGWPVGTLEVYRRTTGPWDEEHVALVERALGEHARGTGGMALTFLRRTTRFRFFPVLWSLRDELVIRGGGELVGRPTPPATG